MAMQLTLFPDTQAAVAQRYFDERGRRRRRQRENRGHHENSREAHASGHGPASGRRAEILRYVAAHGDCTDRDICAGLFGPGRDMNLVRPRVTELLRAGLLIEAGNVRDPVTGMTVRRVCTY
jgi:hypothetical protein